PRVFKEPSFRLAVIPIAFPDVELSDKVPPKSWEAALFSKGTYRDKSATGQPVYGSVNDYYQEISCGKFRVEGKVFDGVTVGKKRGEYTQTASRTAVLTEACDQLLKREGEEALRDFDGVFFI